MSQAAHCLPRHQTWAGYTTHTDVHNIYTHHYDITRLFDIDVSGIRHRVPIYWNWLICLTHSACYLTPSNVIDFVARR